MTLLTVRVERRAVGIDQSVVVRRAVRFVARDAGHLVVRRGDEVVDRAAAVALKDALHADLGHSWFVGRSDVAESHMRRMSPFYKALVTVR